MFRKFCLVIAFLAAVGMAVPACADSSDFLTFGGLQDQETVGNFYNGGTGGFGSSSGLNFGITFSSNTLALRSYLQGGSGAFKLTPTSTPAIFFSGSGSGYMNVASGFSSGIQFFYAAGSSTTISVWSGANGTGSLLATITLTSNAGTGSGCSGFPSYCNWTAAGLSFAGTAKSVTFNGTANQYGIADITIGSSRTALPEPASLVLLGTGLVGIAALKRGRKMAQR